MNRLACMFSGGTDSTAATALLAPEYERVHLITYRHSGLSKLDNSRTNVEVLRTKFGPDKFVHDIIDMDRLFKAATYSDYRATLRRYGFFTLTSCGCCKLAMHVRTIVYCLENDIRTVADGANVNMAHFPDQMKEMLDPLRALYKRFGIDYLNPVFEYGQPTNIDWLHKVGLHTLVQAGAVPGPVDSPARKTTGQLLFEMGILPVENVKGTPRDRVMQARCFQLTLLNVFALGYYIPRYGMERYREMIARFYGEKIRWFQDKIEDYLQRGQAAELSSLIDR